MRTFLSIFMVLVLSAIGCSTLVAQQLKQKRTHPMTVEVKGIDNRNSDGVTRLTVILTSLPNTSSRIDSVSLVTAAGIRMKALDIDGVDFQRYFQWEDEGAVDVEVDFTRQKSLKGSKVVFHTVYGDFTGVVKGGIGK